MRSLPGALIPLAAAAALLSAAPTAGGASGGWSAPHGFPAGSDAQSDPVPRAAIARDGTSALAFRSKSGALMLATGSRSGRFGGARVIERSGVRDYSIAAAPAGAFLLAWEDSDGLHAAVRTKAGRRIVARRYDSGPGSAINGVQVAADPQAGLVIAQRVYPHGPRRDRLYGVRALSLDPAGRLLGGVEDLGPRDFGIDARPRRPGSRSARRDRRAVRPATRRTATCGAPGATRSSRGRATGACGLSCGASDAQPVRRF